MAGTMAPLLQAIDIGKTYPGGVVANDGVNLTVNAGEVHAVVGENGAGKSTLMKIMFGVEQADRGQLRLAGEPVRFANPRAAIDAGIGMVFQHFSLVPSFSVYENVVLGSEPRSGIRFDRRKAIEEVRALSARFRLHVDPLPPVGQLPVGQQQRVEILKALYRDARILILDEPTAVLAPQEVTELFVGDPRAGRAGPHRHLHRPQAARGAGDLRPHHGHARRQDRRRGGHRGRHRAEPGHHDGRPRGGAAGRAQAASRARSRVAVNKLRLRQREAAPMVCDDVTLTVRSGEIVGLVGVEGNGQAELLEAVAGLRSIAGGDIVVDGESIMPLGVLDRRGKGMASIPEDRIAEGLAAGATVAENLVATRLDDQRFVRHGLLDLKARSAPMPSA